jgi:hypothetical protein
MGTRLVSALVFTQENGLVVPVLSGLVLGVKPVSHEAHLAISVACGGA